MSKPHWEVMPGVGDHYLEIMGDAVRQLQRYTPASVRDFSAQRLEELREGVAFGDVQRAEITILEEGVCKRRAISQEFITGTMYLGKKKEIKPGTVMKGWMTELISRPALGGELMIQNIIPTLLVGLVDPVAGSPRVKLDILTST